MEDPNLPHAEAAEIIKNVLAHLAGQDLTLPTTLKGERGYFCGIAVWDIFSNNHDVITDEDMVVSIGSWRGSGRTIADALNELEIDKASYSYLDFYMDAMVIDDKSEFSIFYDAIFDYLKNINYTWRYSMPQIYAFGPGTDKKPESDGSYESVVKEIEQNENKNKLADFLSGVNEQMEIDSKKTVPHVIRSYIKVYDKLPEGYEF
jgi:hypothetical protein